jgi:ribosomal-protein-serine acetyltransferase
MRDPILLDIPSQIDSERLLLHAPNRTGDGSIVNQAIKDSFNELKAWLPFAQKLPAVEETEINLRKAHINFLKRESLDFSFFVKGRMSSSEQSACKGSTGPFLNVK